MSQTATLYRISAHTFRQLNEPGGVQQFDNSQAKSYVTFEGSFMGLEYILSKEQDTSVTQLIHEIFNPGQSLGGQYFENLSPEEQLEFYESGKLISYLDSKIISSLAITLTKFRRQIYIYDTIQMN